MAVDNYLTEAEQVAVGATADEGGSAIVTGDRDYNYQELSDFDVKGDDIPADLVVKPYSKFIQFIVTLLLNLF